MGLVNGALQIGKTALLAYQSALQVTGNNIANAGSSVYTRQTPVLHPVIGGTIPEGFMPGGGVALADLRRNVDESLMNRLRTATSQMAMVTVQQQNIGRIEGTMNELSEVDLSTLLQQFFNSFSALQNDPQSLGQRDIVLNAADSLISALHRQRTEVLALRDELNSQIQRDAETAADLIENIRDLNVRIVAMEGGGQFGANALRDQRDQYLSELSEIIQIQVREQPDGSINVYVGNDLLIQGGMSRGVMCTLDNTDGVIRATVRFADNGGTVTLWGGRLAGLQTARDEQVLPHIEQLDGLAAALIQEVNKIHASGQGLSNGGWFTEVDGTCDVDDANLALNDGQIGLDLVPRNGSFLITLTDSTGVATTTTITVDLDGIGADDSLNSLAAKINASVASVTATVTSDHRLELAAADGYTMTFAEDTSYVLAALGINTFFTGSDAMDIGINQMLLEEPARLAAATDRTPGDGTNAARLAALGNEPIAGIRNQSLIEFYNLIVNDVAVKGAAAKASVEAHDAVTTSLSTQRESISGVSLDEETIMLLKLERSFQGAARFTSVVDQLIEEMLGLLG
jgi:flagellar hook-associated protein 1 FlgK